MSALELLRTWGYATALAAFVGFVAYDALARRPPVPVSTPSPARSANDPQAGVPDSAVRDPFVTGAEWRARMRERLEPATAPSAPGAASAKPRAPPAAPDFQLQGTMIGSNGRFAVLSVGQYTLGAAVRGYKIEQIELDRIVVSRGGERFVLRVPGSGPAGTPEEGP